MSKYLATVLVEYQFEIDTEEHGFDSYREVEDHAYYNFDDYAYSSTVYSVAIDELESDEDDEEEDEDE